jgi:hypothetical protein
MNCNEHAEPDPTQLSDFGAIAYLQASWSDAITINNAVLNGTVGYLRPVILYSGKVSANCAADVDGASSDVSYNLTGSSDYYFADNQFNQGINTSTNGQLNIYRTNSPQTVNINVDAAGLAAANGLANLDIEFIYGRPFDLTFTLLLANGDVGGGVNWTQNQHGAVKLQWQGAQVFDANSNQVSNFTLTSDSGTDWTKVQGGTGAVPQISGLNVLNRTNLVINGTNGTSFNQVFLLGSTNLALAMTNWTHLDTNSFDFTGNVSFTNATGSSEPERYYRLLSQ